jgi:branched-chain amino acid transport system permease protein
MTTTDVELRIPAPPAASPVRPVRRTRREAAILVAAAVVVVAAQPALGPLGHDRAVSVFTLVALASAWNLVAGFGGLFSIGHAVFVGTGSYASAMVLVHTSLPTWFALMLGGAVAGAIGLVVAVPLMRLRAAYFSVASLGIALAGQAWMINWRWTGGSQGIHLPVRRFVEPDQLYWFAGAIALVTVGVSLTVARSGLGLRLMALRDDEDAAAEIGVRRTPVVLATWTISTTLVGLAGGVIAVQTSSLEPNSAFAFSHTLNMILATVLGGIATVVGPILGAVVLYAVQLELESWKDWASVVLGLAVIATIRFVPGGLWGLVISAARRVAPRSILHRRKDPRCAAQT